MRGNLHISRINLSCWGDYLLSWSKQTAARVLFIKQNLCFHICSFWIHNKSSSFFFRKTWEKLVKSTQILNRTGLQIIAVNKWRGVLFSTTKCKFFVLFIPFIHDVKNHSYYTEILTQKGDLRHIFVLVSLEKKTLQLNFSCQNFSIENSCFPSPYFLQSKNGTW